MVNDKDRVTREGMLGACIPFIIVTLTMIILTFGIYFGLWQWWMWIAIMGSSVPAIITMIYYFGRDSKICPKCGIRMNFNIKYCKRCGTHIPAVCSSCGTTITGNNQFCENCGKELSSSDKSRQTSPSKKKFQYLKQTSDAGRLCPGCGGNINLEAQYCSSCGFTL